MSQCHKRLRILWIDDHEQGLPELELPEFMQDLFAWKYEVGEPPKFPERQSTPQEQRCRGRKCVSSDWSDFEGKQFFNADEV